MADEQIKINLQVGEEFFQDLDRRFDALAKRASQAFASSARGVGTGLGAGQVPGGGSNLSAGAGGMSVGGAFGDAAAQIFKGAGAGIAGTQGSSAQSPRVLADNATVGALNAGVGLAKTGLSALGGIAGGAVAGPGGAVAGAALGGTIGDLIQAQFNSIKDKFEIPKERGIARLQGLYGTLAAAGIKTTRAGRQQAIDFTNEIETRRYDGEQEIARQYRESHPTSAAFGLAWNGR